MQTMSMRRREIRREELWHPTVGFPFLLDSLGRNTRTKEKGEGGMALVMLMSWRVEGNCSR